MKKNNYVAWFVIVILFAFACQKKENSQPADSEQGVAFLLNEKSSLKSTDCYSRQADYAQVVINGTTYKTDVFYINSKPYTNTIKLDAGNYTLSEFMLMDDNNTPEDTSDDVMVAATPHAGSEFASFVDQPLDLLFTVEAFKKTQVNISVLCYEESSYSSFGFIYYEIGQITVREQFFFGDICICNPSSYDGSLYTNQSSGLQLDMPAIAKIEVWRNGVKAGEYSNESWYGEGQPLKVLYADVLNHEDNFEFKLFVLVKQGTDFNYVHVYSWTFKDDERIPNGTDGVVDFVLGNCSPGADLVLPAWMNNPPNLTYTITGWEQPALGGYVDVTLSNIPEGYEITNGIYPSNCADHSSPINVGVSYEMNVYSSLYPAQLPPFAQSDKWEKINWLYNHLDWYPGYHWYDVQGFLWLYDNPAWDGAALGTVPALTALTQQMKADADQYGVGYKVPTGGTYVLIFIPPGAGDVPLIQTMITELNSCD